MGATSHLLLLVVLALMAVQAIEGQKPCTPGKVCRKRTDSPGTCQQTGTCGGGTEYPGCGKGCSCCVPEPTESQCATMGGFCVTPGRSSSCYGTVSFLFNNCDDQCACCVTTDIGPEPTEAPEPVVKTTVEPPTTEAPEPIGCLTTADVPCVFPFRYYGVLYDGCTNVGWDTYWCATEVDANDNYIDGKFGNCKDDCPKIPYVAPEPTEAPEPSGGGDSGGSDCNCEYASEFSASHTMNKYSGPADACGVYHDYKLTDDDIQIILSTHNELRQKVAKGEETQGAPGPQPSATNMYELRWNCELAEVAQRWAEQCQLGHDKGDDRKICNNGYYVGQNAFMEWHFSATPAWEKSVNNWYSEVQYMPPDLVDSFGSHPQGKVIGHYTQVVWAETYEVGCGGIHFPSALGETTYKQSKVYVCNYGEGGNWLGSAIYEIGAAASNCPHGESTAYPGLCAPPA